jgi:ketosteroid isomerase-like protein
MTSGSNLERLKAAYQLWHDTKGDAGSMRNWLALMDERIQLRSMGDASQELAFATTRTSRDGVLGYFDELLANWEMVDWSPETFVESGDRIAMFGRCGWVNRTTKKKGEVRIAHLWTFQDGKVIDIVEVFDTARMVAAATP